MSKYIGGESSLKQDVDQYTSISNSKKSGIDENRKYKWAAYTAVAGSVIAMSSTVEAAVIYSGIQNISMPNGQNPSILLDINGDAVTDFTFITSFNNSGTSYGYAAVKAGVNGIAIPGGLKALKLSTGDVINSGLLFLENGKEAMLRSITSSGFVNGFWGATSTGLLGAKLNIGADSYYAWIRVALGVDTKGYPDDVTIIDWAYEDTGAAILAGVALDIAPPPSPPDVSAVPLPGSLGLLASGVAGLVTFRKRRRNPDQ